MSANAFCVYRRTKDSTMVAALGVATPKYKPMKIP